MLQYSAILSRQKGAIEYELTDMQAQTVLNKLVGRNAQLNEEEKEKALLSKRQKTIFEKN